MAKRDTPSLLAGKGPGDGLIDIRARRIGTTALVLAASLACPSCASGDATAVGGATSSPTGTRATDFAVRDTKGRTVRLSDYLGKKVVLLDFWATYCEPCLGEMPYLEKMYEENKDKGFVIIALSMDGPETVAEVPSFAARNGLTFPVTLDEDSHVASIYNPKSSAPLSVLIDKQGNVVRVREGYNPGDETLVLADVVSAVDGKPLR
ncbi:MAG: peroxiredoxin family protein [Polyangiaceae bacterium]|jgi:peroxiredoxin